MSSNPSGPHLRRRVLASVVITAAAAAAVVGVLAGTSSSSTPDSRRASGTPYSFAAGHGAALSALAGQL